MLLVYILILALAFYLLAIICDEFFVPALDEISKRLKLPSDVAGATFMAVGSSAPELFTALFAVFRPGGEHADMGAGTIVGSAIFNILVIIGAAAMIKRAKLTWQPIVRDVFFYSISIIMLLVFFWDSVITLMEALYFLALYLIYLVAVVKWKKIFPYEDVEITEEPTNEDNSSKFTQIAKRILALVIPNCEKKPNLYIWTFTISILAIAVLSFGLVESAVMIGEILNINPTIIALTVLAGGTSIPDLISSVIVAKRGRGDMAVSNAIGSNIFDILFGLGFPWMLAILIKGETISVENENLIGSVVLLFATVLSVLFILIVRRWKIGRRSGIVLILIYVAYVIYNIVEALR
jgi:K+-dependent Na+/Ca+ exchanger-like protein